MNLRSILHGSFASAFIQIFNTASQATAAIMLSRLLGPAGYGAYAFALAVASFLQMPVQIGLRNTAVRFASVYAETGEWDLLRGLLRRLMQWGLSYSAAASIILAILVVLYGRFVRETDGQTLFLAATLIVLLMPLPALLGGFLRGYRKAVLGQTPEFVLRPAALLIFVGLAYLLTGRLTPVGAMAVNGGSCLFAAAVALYWLRRYRPNSSSSSPARFDSASWARAIVPLSMAGGMLIINSQASTLLLGLLSNSDQVGIYRVAFQSCSFVSLGLTGINLLIGPDIARLNSSKGMAELQRVVTHGARLSLVWAIPIAAGFIFFGRPFVTTVFGQPYTQAYPVLLLISVAQLIAVSAGSVGFILNMTGHERDTFVAYSLCAVSNILLLVVLVPRAGAVGAAFANLATLPACNLYLVYRTLKQTGLDSTALGGAFWGRYGLVRVTGS